MVFITTQTVKEAKALAKVDFVTAKAVCNKANIKLINRELNVIEHVGLDNWKSNHVSPLTKQVILELNESLQNK